AVYTAEEDRHLMFGLTKFQFDVALAEVTFTSGFSVADPQHIRVEFFGQLLESIPFINPITKQQDGSKPPHPASLQDWTRLSPVPCRLPTDPPTAPSHPGCNRSGPNETKVD